MSSYQLVDKEAFTVAGIGTELISEYTDFEGLNREKHAFLEKVMHDGTLKKLRQVATNMDIYIVNEAVNNKKMFYIGVLANTVMDEARMIQFPKSKYLVSKDKANDILTLNDSLTNLAFGHILPKANDFAYVGGPNGIVITEETKQDICGELLIPVVDK
ncbi:GyrI-like domain-containing protein [Enterococcus sp. BWT-B8]|uniref:effector binding domain-containing protein n=1 Tax=unclassified Enterococcus TaxID=2608891 RepID=UPI001E4662AA|nr:MULTISPECIES: effector binding domain-containing protein [unclassified Enterococcus]MCB5951997.1 GyrI-like domain-containing protein [Enterococcus sp. BWT-B8]MCB5954195.1 GyrI-like domain-containing protein [Enterococcus sp. CWB-B31]